jgi:hypothetical protein
MKLEIGQKVQWRSQAQGSSLLKEGEIVGVIAVGERPSQAEFPALYRGVGPGYGRKEESYVVKVGYKLYWPRTSLLKPAGPTDLERARDLLRRIGNVLATSDPDYMPITRDERDALLGEIRSFAL